MGTRELLIALASGINIKELKKEISSSRREVVISEKRPVVKTHVMNEDIIHWR